jgi:hypothetical protein
MPMNATIRHIPLIVGESGDVVAAELRDRIEDHNLHDWRTQWLPILGGGGALDWPERVDTQRRIPDYRASFAIECEGTTQGMIAVRSEMKRKLRGETSGRGFIEILFLESAPWNRADLSEHPRFRGVGRMLVVAAIALSLSKGFAGRVGVLALNESTEFFAKCGMTDFGQDTEYPHLHVFEMTADQAEDFVATTFTRLHRLLSSQESALGKLGRGWSAIDRWFE